MIEKTYGEVSRELFEIYEAYKVPEITSRRFTHNQMLLWLAPLEQSKIFDQKVVGSSAEGRAISLLSLGRGTTKVFLWSQMHGDESTATMALIDMLTFFSRARGHRVVTTIQDNLRLLLLPMLNPDGAERFQRRTAQLIDMNRDALRLCTPEACILKNVRDQYQPEFCFNLHDQDTRGTVGSTTDTAAIALLAPAYDVPKSDNDVRVRAKRVAGLFGEVLHQFIPGHVARYDDTFEPRAFGDNIQKWGTSTVLVESGGWTGDRQKMFLRKLNFVGLLSSLYAIASGEYASADCSLYEQLPFSSKNKFDLILRNVTLKPSTATPSVVVDIAINIAEQTNPADGTIFDVGTVMDIGDLSVFAGFDELDLTGKTLSHELIQLDKVLSMDILQKIKEK
ncbi:MAG: M14 family zinc carboxypeptidase [bacterium]